MDKIGICGKQQEIFSRLWIFLSMVRDLRVERLTNLLLLFALAEDICVSPNGSGLSVAALAHKTSISIESARHAIRSLRVASLVTRTNRSARTEFFRLSPQGHEMVLACLGAFESAGLEEHKKEHTGVRRTRAH